MRDRNVKPRNEDEGNVQPTKQEERRDGADREVRSGVVAKVERGRGNDHQQSQGQNGGITVTDSGRIRVTPTHGGRRVTDDTITPEEEWAAQQEAANTAKNGLPPQPPPSAVLKAITSRPTFSGPRQNNQEPQPSPRVASRPSGRGRGRGRGTVFAKTRRAGEPAAPAVTVPAESGPKRYSIQRGQRSAPVQAVKERTQLSVVTDPRQQEDLLNSARGPQTVQPHSSQTVSLRASSSVPTATIPPFAILEPLTPAEQLVIHEFRHQIHVQQEEKISGRRAIVEADGDPRVVPFPAHPVVDSYAMYPQGQQMTVLPTGYVVCLLVARVRDWW